MRRNLMRDRYNETGMYIRFQASTGTRGGKGQWETRRDRIEITTRMDARQCTYKIVWEREIDAILGQGKLYPAQRLDRP